MKRNEGEGRENKLKADLEDFLKSQSSKLSLHVSYSLSLLHVGHACRTVLLGGRRQQPHSPAEGDAPQTVIMSLWGWQDRNHFMSTPACTCCLTELLRICWEWLLPPHSKKKEKKKRKLRAFFSSLTFKKINIINILLGNLMPDKWSGPGHLLFAVGYFTPVNLPTSRFLFFILRNPALF